MKTETIQLVARPPIHPATFDKLDPQRRDQIHLYVEGSDNDVNDEQLSSNVRYTLTIIDRSGPASIPTALFLIPAGREAEYMFTHGLSSIADSANTSRLIAVSQGRHHVFHSTQQIQDELAYVCQILHRGGSFVKHASSSQSLGSIPFMALSGVGEREVLHQGVSELSGAYVIEQVVLDDNSIDIGDKGKNSLTVRRLYFQNNPFVIQSELYYKNTPSGLVLDPSRSFEYHKTMVAGLASLSLSENLLAASGSEAECATSPESISLQRGLLLGLGGGGFIHLVHWILPRTRWAAIELDPEVVELAQRYFDLDTCVESGFLQIRVGNALHVSAGHNDGSELQFVHGSLSFIAIDVDSKDTTLGMSCPPPEFVDVSYLEKLSMLLCESGVLAVNVSARDNKLLEHACQMIHSVFPFTLISSHEDSINVVVFASRRELRPNPLKESVPAGCLDDLNEAIANLVTWDHPITKRSPKNGKKNKKKKGKRK